MKILEEKLEDFLWSDNRFIDKYGKIINSHDVSACGYGFRMGWKAALKWAMNDADKGYCQCGYIEESIRKELGEEDERV